MKKYLLMLIVCVFAFSVVLSLVMAGTEEDDGKLKLKGSRERKAQDKINEILNKNVLDELHSNCVQTLSQYKMLVSSKETVRAQKESKELQRDVAVLNRRIKTLEVRMKSIEQQSKELLDNIKQKRVNLEKLAFDNFGKTVNIKL